MVRLDDAIWLTAPAGGLGPAGWLGSAANDTVPEKTFYAPLHDYQIYPPDLSPATAARVRTIEGRSDILDDTVIEDYTNILSAGPSRRYLDADWIAVVGQIDSVDEMITLYHPFFEDRRLAVFAFMWASTEGREDAELSSAVAFVSVHALATNSYVGVVSGSDDPALIEQYSVNQPHVRGPWDMLVDLGRQDLVGP